MTKAGEKEKTLGDLRKLAEKKVKQQIVKLRGQPSMGSAQLIHELQVHQIELEMQNEELGRTQLELKQSRSKYFSLFDLAPVGYFILDEKGLIQEANLTGATLLGVEGTDLVKKPFSRYVSKDNADELYLYRKRVFQMGIQQTCELKLLKKDGTEFYGQLVSVALTDPEGNFTGLRTAVIDITERKRAEDALREAQEELIRKEKLAVLGLLAGGVAHELRNPLAVIANAAFYLKITLPDADETTKEYLEMISSEVRDSEKIVSDLLGFTRTKTTKREHTAVFDLVSLALKKKPAPEDVKVSTEIAADLPTVFVDSRQMRQVLVNLITNAYQAMPEGGTLTIDAQANNDKVNIFITDTGCGIPEQNMKKLFEPLYSARAHGIGLGLSVSKNLVETNKGSIKVESSEGKGSTFTVILPTKEVQS
jgi:PAS domain S-box-containing protein